MDNQPEPVANSWQTVFAALSAEPHLDPSLAAWAMTEILQERATDAQAASFALALKVRGEQPKQVSALAAVLMEHANIVPDTHGKKVILDIVGTGGDGSQSVNISTMAAVVAASCGQTVIKHGNRAFSSSTGAADVLEELGVVIDLNAEQVARVVTQTDIGFAFAPRHHPAMRFAAPARKQLAVPTVFNILGPLTNPAGANAGLIGCANIAMAPIMASVLADRGVSALVVRGQDGLDEISLSAETDVWIAARGTVTQTQISPDSLGIREFNSDHLRGGEKARNAELTRKTLGGESVGHDEAVVASIRQSVAVNAAAALVAASIAWGKEPVGTLSEQIMVRLPECLGAMESGNAWKLMQTWVTVSQNVAQS